MLAVLFLNENHLKKHKKVVYEYYYDKKVLGMFNKNRIEHFLEAF